MIERWVRFSVAHREWVLGLTLAGAVLAAVASSRLQLDALPDITNNQVLVLTRAPGLTPEEMELRVTRPLEVSLGGMQGLRELRSVSRYGLSSVTTVFDDAVDPYLARQLVQERINRAASEMPEGVEAPELGPLSGGLGEVYHFTLSSPDRTGTELLELVQLRVAPLLRQIPGVAEVNTWGGERRALVVRADPLKLAQRRVSLRELRVALEESTGAAAGASLPAGDRQVLLRGVARPQSPGELAEALVRKAGAGPPLRVADVAEVGFEGLPRLGTATANGRGETVYVMVQMLRGVNALRLTEVLEERMPALQTVLPPDVRLQTVYDRAHLVRGTLVTMAKNLLEGGALVVAVLFLMLGSLRAGLLVASTIPLSMLGATAGMVALDIPGNLMSLGAIDFGLLVDGAVVMVEGLFHHWHTARNAPNGTRHEVADVTASLGRPVFFSVLIIMLVYVPVLTLGGVDGKMFRPMAMTVVFALAMSLLLSLTFIPAASSLLLRPQDVPLRLPWLARALERAYAPMLRLALVRRGAVVAGALALLGVGAVLYLRAGTEFTPQLDEGDLVIQTTRAPDIRVEAAIRMAGDVERALLEDLPEVKQVVSRVGSPAVATDLMGLEQADVFVQLKPRSAWRPGLTREALIEQMQHTLEEKAPGSNPSFTQPIQMRFNELLGGAVTDVSVSVYGEDPRILNEMADQVSREVARQPGAADVRVLAPPEVPLIEVVPRALSAAQAGLSVEAVLEAVQAVRTGVPVGTTYVGPLAVPLLLRLDGAPDAFSLKALPLPTGEGGAVPLGQVAEVRQLAAPGLVSRFGGERRRVVGFNVRGADLGTVVRNAQQRVASSVRRIPGYRLEWGGQYETLREAQARLSWVLPAVGALIFAVLWLAFRHVRPALAIFSNVPFACVGGMLALWARGLSVSISSAVGFIALSGIAVLNGVVLMSREQALQAQGVSAADAVERAARERARPVLTTAGVAMLGFIPMALATGVGAEVQRPLATVVVGGLLTSTLLTLVVLPAVWPRFSGRRRSG